MKKAQILYSFITTSEEIYLDKIITLTTSYTTITVSITSDAKINKDKQTEFTRINHDAFASFRGIWP